VVSVADLEQKTGIDFFCNLPDQTEREVENVRKAQLLSDWGL
jgi:endonuclease G